MARQTTKIRKIVKLLRSWGYTVKYEKGWATRGSSTFDPQGFIAHHDVSPKSANWGAYSIVRDGRPGLPGPLAHFMLARDGQIAVIAAGRANHAGTGRVGSFGALRGNTTAWGCEAANTGTGEKWGEKQLNAYYALARACEEVTGYGRNRTIGHKEWAPTRKIDPKGINMDTFRKKMSNIVKYGAAAEKPAPPVQEDDEEMFKHKRQGDGAGAAAKRLVNDWLGAWNALKRLQHAPESNWLPLNDHDYVGTTLIDRVQYICNRADPKSVPDSKAREFTSAHLALVASEVDKLRTAAVKTMIATRDVQLADAMQRLEELEARIAAELEERGTAPDDTE